MKATILMKIAVVFMAAFGAYAFSGNAKQQTSAYIHQNEQCMNINNVCDLNGVNTCRIETLDNEIYPVWEDTQCLFELKHSDYTPIKVNY